jgi:uncharacterized protein (DUF433 family)
MTALETVQVVPLTQLDDGTIIVTGAGVALEIIVARHNAGDTPAEIQEGFPTLELADIYSVIAYYLSHRDEIDDYVRRQKARTQAARQRFESDPEVAAHLTEVRGRIRDFRSKNDFETLTEAHS